MPFDAVRHALITSDSRRRSWSDFAGRVLDVSVALVALVCLAPLMGLVAFVIRLENEGPVFFWQQRIGRFGARFQVLKFRTMCVRADEILAKHLQQSQAARNEWAQDHKLRDDPRVSKLGNFLRKTSFDELPQLWNVLRGDMSIVGPRPIVEAEVVKYGACFDAYCSVRPGITGIWQVSGRNDISYQRRIDMDALYARKKSVLLDLRIMLATIPAVLFRRGSY